MTFEFVCVDCATRHDASRYRLRCDECGGLLDATYDGPDASTSRVDEGASGLARYLPLLPIHDANNLVTMGEGETPVVSLAGVGATLGLERLIGKLEFTNPTGSFKDRGNAVQVSLLKETGVSEVVEVTISNAGQSFAAYCARANIHCIGFVGAEPPDRKTKAIALHGVELHPISGDRASRFEAARVYAEEHGLLFMNYGENSAFVEGQKTMAYEIGEQMRPLPDHILAPAGNGSIILGLWRGFKDMLADGRIDHLPRLYAVQTEETQPIVAAFEGRAWQPAAGGPTSAATGIGIVTPPRLEAVVEACRESGGRPVAVAEEALLHWQRELARLDGLLVEPTSATVLAAAHQLRTDGTIGTIDLVLLPLTGSGMKQNLPHP